MSANYKSVLTVPMFLPNHTVAMTNRSFFQRTKHSLILSSVQSNTDTFANQTMWIQNRPIGIYAVCHLVIDFLWNPYLQQWMCPISEVEKYITENQGWKG